MELRVSENCELLKIAKIFLNPDHVNLTVIVAFFCYIFFSFYFVICHQTDMHAN